MSEYEMIITIVLPGMYSLYIIVTTICVCLPAIVGIWSANSHLIQIAAVFQVTNILFRFREPTVRFPE